ncbi:hypothetical protein [Minwuia thermotolerans]|uniref:Uncharacterized protein n=1 Tax=Minwuia thermotolerans TaxID=2056226 RepID=A0A2M9FXN5_9PROT|nr:hypothetical protein [Minwuia thermotolerans]PJK28214.1 hypothetical protein CVT23_17715 [Minwuia thermotolerans]
MDPTAFILPLAGIALIVVLVWLLRGGRSVDLDEGNVSRALADEGLSAVRTAISADRKSGLAWLAGEDRLAVIRSMGDDVGVSVLAPDDVSRLTIRGAPPLLTVHFRTLGQSRLAMRFAGDAELDRWRPVLALYGDLGEKSVS